MFVYLVPMAIPARTLLPARRFKKDYFNNETNKFSVMDLVMEDLMKAKSCRLPKVSSMLHTLFVYFACLNFRAYSRKESKMRENETESFTLSKEVRKNKSVRKYRN